MSIKTMAYVVCDWPGCGALDSHGPVDLRPVNAAKAREEAKGWSRVLGLDFCGDTYGIEDGTEVWCAQRVKGEHKPKVVYFNAGSTLQGYDVSCRCGWSPGKVVHLRPDAIAAWHAHLPELD
jgi:hypothetical protein